MSNMPFRHFIGTEYIRFCVLKSLLTENNSFKCTSVSPLIPILDSVLSSGWVPIWVTSPSPNETSQMAAIKLQKLRAQHSRGSQTCKFVRCIEKRPQLFGRCVSVATCPSPAIRQIRQSGKCIWLPMPSIRIPDGRIFNSLTVAKRAEKYTKAAQWGKELLCDVQCCGTWLKTTPKHIWQLSRVGKQSKRLGWEGGMARTLNRLAVRQPHDRAQTHELAGLIYGRHEWSQSQPGHQPG